ncbi:MAG TPA: hypothetical protein ENJ38_00515 [Rhodospirillales bacterium]|nr:hypothetical protein [Rhodospirillales bacterium]
MTTERRRTPVQPLDRILETVLYVDDLEAAEAFYGGVLGLECTARRPGLFVFFRVGRQMLLLFDPEGSANNRDLPPHGARGPGHVCFAVPEAELEAWRTRLVAHGVAIEHVQRWPAGARSIYFRDPAGNSVELAPPVIWGLA